jgi:hypothetical protein
VPLFVAGKVPYAGFRKMTYAGFRQTTSVCFALHGAVTIRGFKKLLHMESCLLMVKMSFADDISQLHKVLVANMSNDMEKTPSNTEGGW